MNRNWLLLTLSAVLAGCGPRNYDDCVLENMRGATSDVAAREIRESCESKFPEVSEAHDVRPLTEEELEKLTGKAGLRFGNYYAGSIYNGNSTVTVSEFEIGLITTSGGEKKARAYNAAVTVPPRTTKDFGFDIITGDSEAEYKWKIIRASGYER